MLLPDATLAEASGRLAAGIDRAAVADGAHRA